MAEDLVRGLLLDDGDLAFDSDGRLVEVRGRENLVQNLVTRVLTPLGSDVFNVGYGLDTAAIFAQAANARQARELIRLNLVRTLGTDPRVREVVEVAFPDAPEYVAAHPEVDADAAERRRASRLWRVEVTIATADDRRQTLQLTIGA